MSDNRKYYYLKLKENYFDDDSIVLLESMQDGVRQLSSHNIAEEITSETFYKVMESMGDLLI